MTQIVVSILSGLAFYTASQGWWSLASVFFALTVHVSVNLICMLMDRRRRITL